MKKVNTKKQESVKAREPETKESRTETEKRISRVRSEKNFFCKRRVEKRSREREDQATKGLRRMPRYMAPKKDVTSCEKLRGGANILRSANIRMRELSARNGALCYTE